MATMTISSLPYSYEAYGFGRRRSLASAQTNGSSGKSYFIIPDVVIEEEHTDEVTVTNQPVDIGAEISDHAYANPAVVRIKWAWSDNSRLINSLISSAFSSERGLVTSKRIYSELLEIKNARLPIQLSTGKRTYPKVILTSIKTTSTVDTESSMICDLTFQEIFTAIAQEIPLKSTSQENPAQTSGTSVFGYSNPTDYGSIEIDSGLVTLNGG